MLRKSPVAVRRTVVSSGDRSKKALVSLGLLGMGKKADAARLRLIELCRQGSRLTVNHPIPLQRCN